ncbi:MAG: FAD-dependent oxidoreductase [Bacteroidetes bacterium]|nr:FAD-dependent oxidoreductase [Bacteroidota bacterium]
MGKQVVVIGGGIAGMEAVSSLASLGMDVVLVEKKTSLGGHLQQWAHLFPNRRAGKEVLDILHKGLDKKIDVLLNRDIQKIEKTERGFTVYLDTNIVYHADAVLIATGFDLFEAWRKEEYGYGIYENVLTSAELEEQFIKHGDIRTTHGKIPARIGFVHCVGSRDEKAGNLYCSKVCCVTAVKQAIEIKERLPEAEVFCFYMDLRMFGMGFEEMYKEAQEKHSINFIRGRLSEAFENQDGSVMVKVEDTLAGKPLRMNVDLLVLMVGMTPSEGTKKIGRMLGLNFEESFFLKPADVHVYPNMTNIPGVFVAGTCTSPKTIEDTITDARSAALKIAEYLK